MKRSILKLLLIGIIFECSCVQQKFKEPKGTNNDFEFATARTIAQLRAGMGIAGAQEIKDNIIISGFVIANDKTGNFFKQIIIDDGTAAIPILLDAYNLYNDYPIGQQVFIKCKGLYTNFYFKLPQLSFLPDERGASTPIPFSLWSKYILKGDAIEFRKPIETTIKDVMSAKPELFNRLITLTDTQIEDTVNTKFYAFDAELSSATNIKLLDCDSNFISIRTSGFANFRTAKPPTGRGALTAIYSVFNNTPQLILRDTVEVNLHHQRCF